MKKQLQHGYILLITFSMLALCTALVSLFMTKAIAHKKIVTALLQRDKLEQFVLSAPAIAQSILSFTADEVEQKEDKSDKVPEPNKAMTVQGNPEKSENGFEKKLLEKVLPVVNKTEQFMLQEVTKDFPVVINLTFFCESGKININGLYDLVGQSFYNEGVAGKDCKVFATWVFEKIAVLTEKPSLLQPFIEHVKQRKLPFNDVTELLAIKEFAACFGDAIFYEQVVPKKDDEQVQTKKQKKLFLTDLFTVCSESDTIQPWLLSPSVCALLDIQLKNEGNASQSKKEEKKIDLSSFTPQANWSKDWDVQLKSVYGISYDKLPEKFVSKLAPQFQASVFSVLATITQLDIDDEHNKKVGIFAILKENKLPDNSITYDVIKIYQV